ncbi:heme/hemin ABC transporter substrate-binding protein [Pseudochelatococcus sp. B33]
MTALFAALVLIAASAAPSRILAQNPPAGEVRERIVAVGGSITEILYDLGLADSIVAVDTTSLFPPEALRDKPNVGYMRALSAEGVLALNPTRILLLDGSGPPDALDLLTQSGLPLVRIGDEPSAQGVVDKIRAVGAATGRAEAAEELAAAVARRFALLEGLAGQVGDPKKVLFMLGFRDGRPLVAGQGTAADGIIHLAGATNAAQGFDGYKPMTDEAILQASPDIVVTMGGTGHALDARELFSRPAFAGTPAARDGRLVSRDGLFLLGFGPRTPQAAADLLHALYPQVEIPAALAADGTGQSPPP